MIKSSLISVLIVFVLMLAGCRKDNFNEIYSNKIKKIKATITSKAQAAQSFQSIIANAYGISIKHRGFKPDATPPNPPPEWTPQEVLKVDESVIRTMYLEQHWREESTVTKTGGGPSYGFTREITHWQGILAERTSHYVEIPFKNVEKISVERPALCEYAIVKLYYKNPSSRPSTEPANDVFKIWILNSQKQQYGTNTCLAALSVLCPNLGNTKGSHTPE